MLSVRATGSQPPLFFVPTGLGDCSYVLSLAKEMDIDCPICALPWPYFNEGGPLTLEAIAAQVILALREIQPKSPYRSRDIPQGQWSAYAIAKREKSLDETTSFVAFTVSLRAGAKS
ncbi:thioesterase domain-containing protein [Bradyrhizobium sp. CCBAU 051011]|uniref:thioesterase domain-containing protein n=1 Tax=Bradyrhizobium sp. CCBAU 051011 TaxID=858422 RepID=UPI001379E762